MNLFSSFFSLAEASCFIIKRPKKWPSPYYGDHFSWKTGRPTRRKKGVSAFLLRFWLVPSCSERDAEPLFGRGPAELVKTVGDRAATIWENVEVVNVSEGGLY